MNRKFSPAQRLLVMCCALTIGSEMLLAQETDSQTSSDLKGYKIIEGDIIVPENFFDPQIQAAWRQLRQWPGGQVPFRFHPNVTPANQNAMRAAMAEWERVANIDFTLRINEGDWVEIRDDTLNASAVGRVGGRQEIMIFNWNNRWIMCHELAHCLGYWHEQSRPDRDTYVRINWENIIDDEDILELPSDYELKQNYPNPFNPSTTIAFALPKPSTVTLKLFDMFGRELATLAEGKFSAGRHQVVFDATSFSSGVYFYRMQANEFSQTRRLTLVK